MTDTLFNRRGLEPHTSSREAFLPLMHRSSLLRPRRPLQWTPSSEGYSRACTEHLRMASFPWFNYTEHLSHL